MLASMMVEPSDLGALVSRQRLGIVALTQPSSAH
jgi:hypothetical protein